MSSFYAELHLAGAAFPVLRCSYSFQQATSERGQASAKVRHGPLQLLLDVPDDDVLLAWAAAPFKAQAGQVIFYSDAQGRLPHESIRFEAGQCVAYAETFEAGTGGGGTGAYVCALTITAPAFALHRGGGPALAAAPAALAAVLTRLSPVAGPTPGLVSMTGLGAAWLDDLETLMGPAADVRTVVATWVTGGLSEKKLVSALRGAVDKRLVFERLVKAEIEKGIHQQRIYVDDYSNVPGVSKQAYNGGNSLAKSKLLANDFLSHSEQAMLAQTGKYGNNNEALDLPDYRTATFTGGAKLIKLPPGTPLFRVTDPGGEGGPWWTLEKPKDLAEVIGGTAVMPEWNGFGKVVTASVPDDGEPFYVWFGPAASQPVSLVCEEKKENGYSLAGGTEQVFLPAIVKDRAAFKKSFKDDASLKIW